MYTHVRTHTVCSREVVKCYGMNNTVAKKFRHAYIAMRLMQLDALLAVGAPPCNLANWSGQRQASTTPEDLRGMRKELITILSCRRCLAYPAWVSRIFICRDGKVKLKNEQCSVLFITIIMIILHHQNIFYYAHIQGVEKKGSHNLIAGSIDQNKKKRSN